MDFSNEIIMSTWLPFLVAGLVQASFGLSVSLLTLLSGHALSRKSSTARLLALSFHYVLGVLAATGGLMLLAVYLFSFHDLVNSKPMWLAIAAFAAVMGVIIALFYYRRGKGTTLWLPRSIADFLVHRTKATKNNFESFLLGFGSILTELIFILSPIMVAGILLAGKPSLPQLSGIALYTLIATLPVIIFATLIAGGHKVSALQSWREKNKRFLQMSAGIGMVALALYLLVYHVMEVAV